MAYTGREKLLDKSCNSIYKLVIFAAKRALEIAEGQPKLVEMPRPRSLRQWPSMKLRQVK